MRIAYYRNILPHVDCVSAATGGNERGDRKKYECESVASFRKHHFMQITPQSSGSTKRGSTTNSSGRGCNWIKFTRYDTLLNRSDFQSNYNRNIKPS
jgi:hypothetical protein